MKKKCSEDRIKGVIKEYRKIVEAGNTHKFRFLVRAWNVSKSTQPRGK